MTNENKRRRPEPQSTVLDAALEYATVRGWAIFPTPPNEKKSCKSAEHSDGRKWGATKDADEIRRDWERWPDAGIGIPTGEANKFWVIEADTAEGHDVDGIANLRTLEAEHGSLPDTLMAQSPSGSIHYYFRWPTNGTIIRNSASEIAPGIDVRGQGGMVVAAPTLRLGKGKYKWLNNADIVDAPDWWVEAAKKKKDKTSTNTGTGSSKQAPLHRIIAAVAVTPNEDLGWEEWNTHAMAIYAATNGNGDGLAIFDWWSKQSPKYDADNTRAKWNALHGCPPTEIGVGSIFKWAADVCPKWDLLAYERPDRTIADQMAEVAYIARLAMLPYMLYEQVRDEAADHLGIRKPVLDEIVKKLRPRTSSDDELQGAEITFTPPEPWPNAVDGVGLIDDMQSAIRKHVILSEHHALAASFWVVHAHAVAVFEHTPRLQFKSPTKRCGKTTALNVIRPMVPKPLSTENITMAALFRAMALWQPTLLIDEADSFLKRENGTDNEDLRGILNSGHARGGAVIRTVGDEHTVRAFPVFGPIAFAWLVRRGRQVADTLADRSITIELRRRLPNEKITRLRSNRVGHLKILGQRAVRWVADHRDDLTDADPTLPEQLGDRAQDNWRPLIAIADAMSEDLGRRARAAAVAIDSERIADEEDYSILALGDVAKIFEEKKKQATPSFPWRDALSSDVIIAALVALEDRPWKEYGRRREYISQRALASLLKPYGIEPRRIHRRVPPPEIRFRGYEAAPIADAAARFVERPTEDDGDGPTGDGPTGDGVIPF